MKLSTWMKKNDLSYREMAKKIKINHTTLYRYVKKERAVPLKIAMKIESYTNGEVSLRDLF
jgi:DNA-binding transcriptional regulator YdaS (Cro superfamily)